MMGLGPLELQHLADGDYSVAVKLEADFPDEGMVRAALYHTQQAFEKKLKALLLLRGVNPPFIHDIERLAILCKEAGYSFSSTFSHLTETISVWESHTRYDPYVNFSEEKYTEAKQAYKEISSMLVDELTAVEDESPEDSEPTESHEFTDISDN